MTNDPTQSGTRFPWAYFAASLLPLALIGGTFLIPFFLDGPEAMGPAMACALLIGPIGVLVAAWGAVRLWLGQGARYPALRSLVWLSAVVGVVGFVAG